MGHCFRSFNIKKGAGTEESNADTLADVLLASVSRDQKDQAAKRIFISDKRTALLSERPLKFLATSEYVAEFLTSEENLDWLAAVIGLCKALEVEAVSRVIDPLKRAGVHEFAEDAKDKDLGRVAKYCMGATGPAPELGTLRHFLQTASHSVRRQETSAILRALKGLVASWPESGWLFRDDGLQQILELVATRFRNRAAHADELTRDDYENCRQLLAGPDGALWRLIAASQTSKERRATLKA